MLSEAVKSGNHCTKTPLAVGVVFSGLTTASGVSSAATLREQSRC